MKTKLKHRLVMDVTFEEPVSERHAYWIMRSKIETRPLSILQKTKLGPQKPRIRKLVLKRWSKLLPYIKNGTIA